MTTVNAADIITQLGAPLSEYTELVNFTPLITGASSAGIGTYTTQAGFYHKVGKIVFVVGSIVWTAHTGTGNMLLDGMPFTIRNTLNYDPEFAIRTENITWPASATMVYGEFISGTIQGQIHGTRSAGGSQIIQMSASGTVHFTGFYLT